MIILVSMRTVDNATYPERRDAISHDWSKFFARYGITPVLVPNVLADVSAFFKLGAAGLLLTGGENLSSKEDPSDRDRTEEQLLTGAITCSMPVFGTCRGLHFINRHFGGQLETSLSEPHVGDHDVRLSTGEVIRINSFHNQGVKLPGVAPALKPFATTDSGVVEGVRHTSLPVVAVQWHPERPNPAFELDNELMQQWLTQCA